MDNYETIHQIFRKEDRSKWKELVSELVYEDKENHELIMKDDPDQSIPILLDSLDEHWTSGLPGNTFVKDSDGVIYFVDGWAPLDTSYIPREDETDLNALRILGHGDTVELIKVNEKGGLYGYERYVTPETSSNFTIIDKSEVPEDQMEIFNKGFSGEILVH